MTLRILAIASMLLAVVGWLDIGADTRQSATLPSLAATVLAPTKAPAISLARGAAAKRVLGPTVVATEAASGINFVARVDTGARTCSIHAEEISIDGASPVMRENIGKTIRFRTVNRRGQSAWLERPIAAVRWIKTSEKGEWRYVVALTLACEGTRKEVLVSLNQRSHMDHALLVGRNLLAGAFLVDVER